MGNYSGVLLLGNEIDVIDKELHKKNNNIRFEEFKEILRSKRIKISYHGIKGLRKNVNAVKIDDKKEYVYFTSSTSLKQNEYWWNISINVIEKIKENGVFHLVIQGNTEGKDNWFHRKIDKLNLEENISDKRIIITMQNIGEYAESKNINEIIEEFIAKEGEQHGTNK